MVVSGLLINYSEGSDLPVSCNISHRPCGNRWLLIVHILVCRCYKWSLGYLGTASPDEFSGTGCLHSATIMSSTHATSSYSGSLLIILLLEWFALLTLKSSYTL